MKSKFLFAAIALTCFAAIAGEETELNTAMLALFKPLPEVAENPDNPLTAAKIDLGRMLYYDTRLSADRTVSCATCHDLFSFGDDGAPVSTGIGGQKGTRSAPTVYNAAIHVAQFWDGREPNVERQAMGPPLNPIEMGMKDAAHVESVLKSIPGYVELFAQAFPAENDPVTFENLGKAIGAFERKLLTPSPFDAYLKGDENALTDKQKAGLNEFLNMGCATCHNGMGVGGHMYQKVGLFHPWDPPLVDMGRFEATKNEAEKGMFKVPSLRNITETAPYFHNGAVENLGYAVEKMAYYQLGKGLETEITHEQITSIVAFLGALKGEIPEDYIKKPTLPADGPDTPNGAE
jgi:cytochrome c peroxidase